MGSAEEMVRPVWVEMVTKFAVCHGLQVIADTQHGGEWQSIGKVSYLQKSFLTYTAMIGSAEGRDIAAHHPEIHPQAGRSCSDSGWQDARNRFIGCCVSTSRGNSYG